MKKDITVIEEEKLQLKDSKRGLRHVLKQGRCRPRFIGKTF